MKTTQIEIMKPKHKGQAFTIIELLVAMSTLTLIVLFTSQLVSGVSRSTELGHAKLTSDSTSRLVFNQIEFDIRNILKRTDIDYGFTSVTTGSDMLSFYANEATASDTLNAPGGDSDDDSDDLTPLGLNLISYKLQGYQLYRASTSLLKNDGIFGKTSPQLNKSYSTGDDSLRKSITKAASTTTDDYHIIGEDVIQFKVAYLIPPTGSSTRISDLTSDITEAGNDFNRIKGIVVGIVVLPEDVRARAEIEDIQTLADLFDDNLEPVDDDPNTAPKDFLQAWEAKLPDAVAADAKGLGSHVQFYQRYYSFQ